MRGPWDLEPQEVWGLQPPIRRRRQAMLVSAILGHSDSRSILDVGLALFARAPSGHTVTSLFCEHPMSSQSKNPSPSLSSLSEHCSSPVSQLGAKAQPKSRQSVKVLLSLSILSEHSSSVFSPHPANALHSKSSQSVKPLRSLSHWSEHASSLASGAASPGQKFGSPNDLVGPVRSDVERMSLDAAAA